ncbi:EAL domain-containing protein [Amaricoccus macauensis]|uniref:EAL domain-containing protein n=1 Tax=Amaricoccus macauensis TaxID=57001 RepID=UPI003C7CF8DE
MGLRPRVDPYHLLQQAEPKPDAGSTGRLEAKARLRFTVAQALAQDRLIFRFQPVASTANLTFAAFHEMVALVRLADGQVVPVDTFKSAIEGTEIGRTVDRFALRRALRILEETPDLRLAVDVSPLSMGDAEWMDMLADFHARCPNACGRLILEIGEDAAVRDADLVNDFARHVREMGPAFALDNFGSGATGFAHFRAFRFDMVKIGAAFCRDVHKCADTRVLLECLQRLALQFEMFSVAQGVECEADAAWLCDAGIDCIQGPYFGKPSARPKKPACPLSSGGERQDRSA